MKSTDELVSSVRNDSRNQDAPNTATSTIGIDDSDLVRYLNYGQERLQSVIAKSSPVVFQKQYQFNLVAGQEEYVIPKRILMGERIVNVRMSFDGQLRNYRDLPEKGIHYRNTAPTSYPSFYIRRSGSILVNPIPTSTVPVVQVTYEEQLDTLALRNGLISSASGTDIAFSVISSTQEAKLVANAYVCVSDAFGNVVLQNGVVSSYNSGTKTLTLSANVSTYLVTGYSLSSLASCYATVGKWTTTHSKLPDNCERYLELYGGYKAFGRDSSTDQKTQSDELSAVEKEILENFQLSQKDEQFIQLVNPSLTIPGEWDLYR